MSFLLDCPHCGPRSVYEFRYGGEAQARPSPEAPYEEWTRYVYVRRNEAGLQTEWWFHRDGCRRWFQARRHTLTHRVEATFWPPEPP